MHLSTSFVEHSLRPGIAGRTPHAALGEADAEEEEEETFSEEEEEEEEEGEEGGGFPGGPGGSEDTFVTLGAPNTAGGGGVPAQ